MEQYRDTQIVPQTFICIIRYSEGATREEKLEYYLWSISQLVLMWKAKEVKEDQEEERLIFFWYRTIEFLNIHKISSD